MDVRRSLVRGALAVTFAATSTAGQSQTKPLQKHPDIIEAKVTARRGDVFDFAVTVSSPYDTALRYADAFRVLSPDGKVLGERILLHDHATEQPFTRELDSVTIDPGITAVVVQGRDQAHGYGGKTLTLDLGHR